MIASGGLSGGLSSSIAGGSFADGFRQGIITSGLNHAMHSTLDNSGFIDEQKANTFEEQILEILKKYKVGDQINLSDFGDILPDGASLAISKITRITETDFKIERTWLGSSKIAKNAGFIIEKNGVLSASNKTVKGILIKPYGLGKSENTFYKPSHIYNDFLIKGNQKSYIFDNKIRTININK
jgi:hypothetical protein